MPMPRKIAQPNRIRFTEQAIAKLKPPPSGNVIWWDSTTSTLGIRVSKTGRKTWLRGTRRLGHWPALSLKDARALMADDAPATDAPTFAELAEEFLEHGRTRRGRPLRASTLVAYRRHLARYAKPLHKRPLVEITRRDIAQLIADISRTSGATTASLVRSILARLFSWARGAGQVDVNPVTDTPSYEVAKRTRVLTDVEIAALWAETEEPDPYNVVLRLILLTGCRRSEIGGLRWSEIDQDGVLRIPGARIKTGTELVLPLPRLALEEIARVPRVVGKPTLFGQSSAAGLNGWSHAKRLLDRRLQFARPWVLHDLRRTVQTRMRGLGIDRDLVNAILNHAMGPVEAAYDHYSYEDEKRDALARWAAELERIVEQRPRRRSTSPPAWRHNYQPKKPRLYY